VQAIKLLDMHVESRRRVTCISFQVTLAGMMSTEEQSQHGKLQNGYMHGPCLVHVWYMHGASMVYAWYIHVMRMIPVWYMIGACMGHSDTCIVHV